MHYPSPKYYQKQFAASFSAIKRIIKISVKCHVVILYKKQFIFCEWFIKFKLSKHKNKIVKKKKLNCQNLIMSFWNFSQIFKDLLKIKTNVSNKVEW